MTTYLKTTIIIASVLIHSHSFSQNKKDSLGLPGDNFDLYGALELFKQAKTPEAFEKAINSNDNEVNNLDLDADGKVDYVKVVDKNNDNSHSLVLQVEVSKTEVQDIAVVEIEKKGSDVAHVQIVGDEELYGKDYIIEPRNTESKTKESNVSSKNNEATDDVYNTGGNASETSRNSNRNDYSDNNSPVIVNVWAWPSVQYVYGPAYVGWSSPYYWGYYPGWWNPWYPVYYPVYYRRVYRYHHPYYYRTSYYRCNNAHNYYYGRRSASETVRQHNRSGYYREKQSAYKNNPVQGRRYNNQPANAGKTMNGSGRARENNVRAKPQNTNRATEQRRSQPAEIKNQGAGNTRGKRATEQRGNTPRQAQNPKQVNRNSGNGNSQPQRANPEQRQRAQQGNQQSRQQGGAPRGQGASPRSSQGNSGARQR